MPKPIQIKVSEQEFLDNIIDLAHLFHWRIAHFRPARTKDGWRTPVSADGKGYPDLTLTREEDKRLIFVEVKSEKGKPSPAQAEWLEALRATGKCEVYLWHPQDWELIESVLEKEGKHGN